MFVIKFFTEVNEKSAGALMNVLDQAINQGVRDVTLLISTPGGSVFHGLSVYNYLKGLPLNNLITHNFGSVDSIGVVMYCAGRIRYSSPQARFLLHGVTLNFQGSFSFEEPQLEEKLKSLKIDIENIAKVISINVGKNVDEVTQTLINRTTLNPDQAKDWGLVHDIKTEMFPLSSQVVSIQG